MIVNVENEIYTELKRVADGISVYKSYPNTNVSFPCIIFREIENSANEQTFDSDGEKHNNISFEIELFSNRKIKEKDILDMRILVDNLMSGYYGMYRVSSSLIPNFADTNVLRYTIRYSCVIDNNKTIFRR